MRGLRWNPETKTARLEVAIPGTRGASRRRKTVFAPTLSDAEAEMAAFRSFVKCEDRPEYLDDDGPINPKKPRVRTRHEQHCVYVISYEGDAAVKVGIAVDLNQRLVNYRTHYWREPIILAACFVSTWHTARDLEAKILGALKRDVIRGEWLHRSVNVDYHIGSDEKLAAFARARGIRAIPRAEQVEVGLEEIAAALEGMARL